ncbi:MAG: hypothetical protein R3E86_04785 [Pseudomonadales bacterium]
MNFRRTTMADRDALFELYRDVAAVPGGLARLADEVDVGYVGHFLSRAIRDGLSLAALDGRGRIVGEVHAFRPGILCFAHVLRVELIARESNSRAIRFYETLGFVIEGRLQARIRNLDGSLEADIPMAWRRDPL